MILSYAQIEEIAVSITMDFNEFFFGISSLDDSGTVRATPIDQLASKYLGLHVSFARLSSDGSICGLTAYVDTEYQLVDMGVIRTIPVKQNEILMDTSFIIPGQVHKLCGKRRFTLAHECAHQILYQLESDESKAACRKTYAAHRSYSLRDLKSREDWNEWQANALGAALLMPRDEMANAMQKFSYKSVLKNYEGRLVYADRVSLSRICTALGVSKTAAIIRLRQLGYIEDHPFEAYVDPLEVWNDEEI